MGSFICASRKCKIISNITTQNDSLHIYSESTSIMFFPPPVPSRNIQQKRTHTTHIQTTKVQNTTRPTNTTHPTRSSTEGCIKQKHQEHGHATVQTDNHPPHPAPQPTLAKSIPHGAAQKRLVCS